MASPEAAADPASEWQRARRKQYLWAAALYVVLAALFIHDWDGFVFESSVRDFWNGKTPYQVAEEQPYYAFLNIDDRHPQWYAYPPVPLFAMALAYIPDILLDLPPFLGRVFLKLPMILGGLGLALVGERWAQHLGKPLDVQDRVRKLLLFNPFLIVIGPVWGMTDVSLMAIYLLGVLAFEQHRPVRAGLLMGLSALIKPFPVLLALPLAAYFIATQGWKPTLRLVATAAATCIAICLPFLLSTPTGFIQQIAVFHIRRPVQGWSIWQLLPEAYEGTLAVAIVSFAAMALSLLALALVAPRMRQRAAPLLLTLAAAVPILFWNRVVNEQYFALIVAPLVLLYGLGDLASVAAQRAARWFPRFAAVFTGLVGYHFVLFVPPDIALLVFRRPVDEVAHILRRYIGWAVPPYNIPQPVAYLIFVAAIAGFVYGAIRFLRTRVPDLHHPPPTVSVTHTRAYAVAATTLLMLLAAFPVGTPETVRGEPVPLSDEPLVGAFYYLWWQNPAHDPGVLYGNWLKVSQSPEMGYYTNTRGVARDHVQMMRDNGIDVAIISYHSGEIDRLRVFMEEAKEGGLLIAPLIELNQIYDQRARHALGPDGTPVRHAAYRMDNATRIAIENFVLELGAILTPDAPVYRVDGRPVVYFYDSYVSGASYDEPSRRLLADKLLERFDATTLRAAFNDPNMPATIDGVLRHFPVPQEPLEPIDSPTKAFYEGNRTLYPQPSPFRELNQSAYWRDAFLELHRDWWLTLRHNVEQRMGQMFWVSGEAFNERAGFEAGIVKGYIANEAFDGSFIYSPSFVWGNHPRDSQGVFYHSYSEIFRGWEDRNIWLTAAAHGDGRYAAYGIAPAYDDTVNRRGLVPALDGTDSPDRPTFGFKIPAFHEGNSTYDLMWDSAITHRPDMVLIATFNEFFEGSGIEPSIEYGDQFLLATGAYRDAFAHAPPQRDVVVLVHERMSRTHPAYSEADRTHLWGLRLVAAASRAYPDANVVAIDGLDPDPRPPLLPAMLVIDGGRDGYNETSLSPAVQGLLATYRSNGVPTIIIGREVAPPLRDLVPSSCAANSDVPLGLSVSHEGPGADDQLDAKDVIATNGSTPDYVQLTRQGSTEAVGYRCPEDDSLAFVNLKPWMPEAGWVLSQPWDEQCLAALTAPLAPDLVLPGTVGCTLPDELPKAPGPGGLIDGAPHGGAGVPLPKGTASD